MADSSCAFVNLWLYRSALRHLHRACGHLLESHHPSSGRHTVVKRFGPPEDVRKPPSPRVLLSNCSARRQGGADASRCIQSNTSIHTSCSISSVLQMRAVPALHVHRMHWHGSHTRWKTSLWYAAGTLYDMQCYYKAALFGLTLAWGLELTSYDVPQSRPK